VTAWENPESAAQMMHTGPHTKAVSRVLDAELGEAIYTSVWVPYRPAVLWVRCKACGRMAYHESPAGKCQCGQTLPEPPLYW